MSAALARVENERDAGRQQLTAAVAVIERQRSELERNSVMVQANQQRAEALRQALQLAEQQNAAWRHGSPPLDRQQVVREELATAMRRRRARAWALRRWSVRVREAELIALSRRCVLPLSHRPRPHRRLAPRPPTGAPHAARSPTPPPLPRQALAARGDARGAPSLARARASKHESKRGGFGRVGRATRLRR